MIRIEGSPEEVYTFLQMIFNPPETSVKLHLPEIERQEDEKDDDNEPTLDIIDELDVGTDLGKQTCTTIKGIKLSEKVWHHAGVTSVGGTIIDEIMDDANLYSATSVGMALSMGARALNATLVKRGIIVKDQELNCWTLHGSFRGYGLAKIVHGINGSHEYNHLVWTPRGVQLICSVVGIPKMEVGKW